MPGNCLGTNERPSPPPATPSPPSTHSLSSPVIQHAESTTDRIELVPLDSPAHIPAAVPAAVRAPLSDTSSSEGVVRVAGVDGAIYSSPSASTSHTVIFHTLSPVEEVSSVSEIPTPSPSSASNPSPPNLDTSPDASQDASPRTNTTSHQPTDSGIHLTEQPTVPAVPAVEPERVLYFAYGSNLSTTQMGDRCPTAHLYERPLAMLRGWEWFIGGRGYASLRPVSADGEEDGGRVVQGGEEHGCCVRDFGVVHLEGGGEGAGVGEGGEDGKAEGQTEEKVVAKPLAGEVFGLLWSLDDEAERELDWHEGVLAGCYYKQELDVELLPLPSVGGDGTKEQKNKQEREIVTALTYIDYSGEQEGELGAEYAARLKRGVVESKALGLEIGGSLGKWTSLVVGAGPVGGLRGGRARKKRRVGRKGCVVSREREEEE